MYEQLTRYVDRLQPAEKRSFEAGGHRYCFLEYTPVVRAYTKDVYAFMNDKGPDYHEYLTTHSVDVSDNLKYISVSSLGAETLLYLLLYIERGERFSAGFRSEFIKNGFINDALKRLKDLDSCV